MNNEHTPIERVNNWIKNSVTLKLFTITILVLLLLIPSSMIKSIISERELLSETTTAEVSEKWAGGQVITGPILTIPLLYEYTENEKTAEIIKHFHILPESYFPVFKSGFPIIFVRSWNACQNILRGIRWPVSIPFYSSFPLILHT